MSIRNAFVFTVFACCVSATNAQVSLQAPMSGYGMAPVVSGSPVATYGAPQWDYRFDAQYNSTIKPYLRWYRRLAHERNQQKYPYYYGPGAMNQGQLPGWFNPYRYMNAGNYDQFMAPPSRNTQGRRSAAPRGEVAPPPPSVDMRRYLDQTSTETRRAWIAYDAETDSTSIVYQKPADQRGNFYEADVVVENGARVTSVDWIRRPSWSDQRSIVSR